VPPSIALKGRDGHDKHDGEQPQRGTRRRAPRRHPRRARHHQAGRHRPAPRQVSHPQDAAGHHRPRADRDGRRQRRRRGRHLRPGGPGLRHQAAVDAAAAGARAVCEPGDGAATRRGHRRRARAAHPGAVRQVLGRVQRHRPVHPEWADHRYRVHRKQSRAQLPRRAAGLGHRGRRRDRHRRGQHRQLPPLRAVLAGAVFLQSAASADLPDGSSAARRDRARSCRAAVPFGGQSLGLHAAGDRHRRHDHCPVAALLPAEL
jgi:hypothetical protein